MQRKLGQRRDTGRSQPERRAALLGALAISVTTIQRERRYPRSPPTVESLDVRQGESDWLQERKVAAPIGNQPSVSYPPHRRAGGRARRGRHAGGLSWHLYWSQSSRGYAALLLFYGAGLVLPEGLEKGRRRQVLGAGVLLVLATPGAALHRAEPGPHAGRARGPARLPGCRRLAGQAPSARRHHRAPRRGHPGLRGRRQP